MKNYVLEIYAPNSGYDVLATLRSETPFQAVHVGDFIDPRVYDLSAYEDLSDKLLRVVAVKHVITVTDDLNAARHHVNIYTEAVPNLEETIFRSDAT